MDDLYCMSECIQVAGVPMRNSKGKCALEATVALIMGQAFELIFFSFLEIHPSHRFQPAKYGSEILPDLLMSPSLFHDSP